MKENKNRYKGKKRGEGVLFYLKMGMFEARALKSWRIISGLDKNTSDSYAFQVLF